MVAQRSSTVGCSVLTICALYVEFKIRVKDKMIIFGLGSKCQTFSHYVFILYKSRRLTFILHSSLLRRQSLRFNFLNIIFRWRFHKSLRHSKFDIRILVNLYWIFRLWLMYSLCSNRTNSFTNWWIVCFINWLYIVMHKI